MRINTNVMALNAQNMLTGNQGAVSKSINKLSSGLRINGADAEAGIGTYAETGDKDYFVKVKLSESVSRTCYLSQSQIKNLKYVNLGFEFKETDEVVNLDDKEPVPGKKVKPIVED